MIRKILVVVISVIYMVLGLGNIGISFYPILFSSGFITLNLFPLIGGALAFYAGLNMFRLNELGRKFVLALLCIRAAINVRTILWSLFYLKDGAWLGLNFLGKQIYRLENRYAYSGLFFVCTVIVLLIIIFLSQKETKKIFTPETTGDDSLGAN